MPKCLSATNSFNIALPYQDKDFSFEAMTIGVHTSDSEKKGDGRAMAIVCAKPELIALKEEFAFQENSASLVAIVESIDAKTGVTLRFSNFLMKKVALRDIASPEKICQNYYVG